jgi:membrane protein involved in colicin uptake
LHQAQAQRTPRLPATETTAKANAKATTAAAATSSAVAVEENDVATEVMPVREPSNPGKVAELGDLDDFLGELDLNEE